MSRRDTRWRISTGVALLLLAFALRMWNIGGPSLWLDEAMMLARAHTSWWTAVAGRVSTDLAPPVFPVLLHVWSGLGVQDALVRFPSVVFGVLAVTVMLRLPRPSPPFPLSHLGERGGKTRSILPPLPLWKRGGKTRSILPLLPLWERGPGGEGPLAALILALAPTQVYHAQQANVYALVALLSALIFVTAQYAARGGRRAWLALAALAAVGAYTYYGLAFLFAGMVGWLGIVYLRQYLKLLTPRMHPKLPVIGVGLAVVGAAILPLVPVALERSAEGAIAWTGSYAVLNDWVGLRIFAVGLVAEGIVGPLFPYAQVPTWLAVTLTVLFALGVWRRPTWFVWGWLVPLGLAYVASGYGVYPFSQRHLLFVAPVTYALLAAGLLALQPTTWRWPTIATLALVLVVGWPALRLDVPWHANLPQEELKPVLESIAPDYRPTDAVYVTYGATAAAGHYQELGLLPADAYMHNGWYAGRVGVQADRALGVAGNKPRLWVVMSHTQPDEEEQLARALTHRGAHLIQYVPALGASALLFDMGN